MRRDYEELARLESLDTGKPLKHARADATVAARYFEFYANTIESFYGDTIASAGEIFAYTLREPYGVTAHIIPWNYPIQISSRSVAPALATGNCCVVKSAEEAPPQPHQAGRAGPGSGTASWSPEYRPGLR